MNLRIVILLRHIHNYQHTLLDDYNSVVEYLNFMPSILAIVNGLNP